MSKGSFSIVWKDSRWDIYRVMVCVAVFRWRQLQARKEQLCDTLLCSFILYLPRIVWVFLSLPKYPSFSFFPNIVQFDSLLHVFPVSLLCMFSCLFTIVPNRFKHMTILPRRMNWYACLHLYYSKVFLSFYIVWSSL